MFLESKSMVQAYAGLLSGIALVLLGGLSHPPGGQFNRLAANPLSFTFLVMLTSCGKLQ